MIKFILNVKYLYITFCTISCITLNAQAPIVKSSGDIFEDLEKLKVLGSILYVAAHPDDENTRLISYYANEVKARTAYLSLTRGDGGQNLIGPEIKELLGVMRTEELMAARLIDGGEQMFSRANDFGYSKNAEETREIWEEKKVMSDVVWAIRKYRPDVIINRFDHTSSGKTHGHHTASAILSYEAFDLSGDKDQFSYQLKYVEPWSAQRLFFNTSWWFYGSREKFAEADKSEMVTIDIGTYYPIKGKSNSEIAAISRSQHVCQGMGNTATRGTREEYLQLLKGDMPKDPNDIFAGINTSWSRINAGHIEKMIDSVIANFNFSNPSKSAQAIANIIKDIKQLPSSHWRDIKLTDAKALLISVTGMYIEAISDQHTYTPKEKITVRSEITNRSNIEAKVLKVRFNELKMDTLLNTSLAYNISLKWDHDLKIPSSVNQTSPYWLKEKGSLGMYRVDDQKLIGNPRSNRALSATYYIEISGEEIEITKDIVYRYNDPEAGPIYRPLEIVPAISVKLKEKVYVLSNEKPTKLSVSVKALSANQSGTVSLPVPKGWKITPTQHDFSIEYKGADQNLEFELTPPAGQSEFTMKPVVKANGKEYREELIKIDYNHIPYQSVMMAAESKMVKLDIKTAGRKIAYIEGSGDAIPKSLEQIGYVVDIIPVQEISKERLQGYGALVMGIRAYNKLDDIRFKQDVLMNYVSDGGNMIVQYNTNRRLKVDNIGPYPIKLSRDRVTVEEAPIEILEPNHPILNYPNKITQQDFDNWVQERGLYFASEWSDKYKAILSSNDPGEPARKGGLLVAQHGDGNFIYTGYSWFRQLPAGVPGAYRIFANMVSLNQNNKP